MKPKHEYFAGRRITIREQHEFCPCCGSDIDVYDEPEDMDGWDYDSELAQAWGFPAEAEDTPTPNNPAARFYYTYRVEKCSNNVLQEWPLDDDFDENWDDFEEEDECDYQAYIFPRRYYDPATCLFDAPRPLTPTEQARHDREQAIAAGQLELPMGEVQP